MPDGEDLQEGNLRLLQHLLLVLALAAAIAPPGRAETRLALVIDQTNYQNASELSRVAQADHEGDLIEAALRDTGFSVTRISDRTKSQLTGALDDFRLRLEQAGPEAVGFIYYTGHGAQHPGTHNSYLLGTDARLRAASDLAVYGIDLEAQRDGFAATGAKAVFLVFDACRNVATGSGFKANVKGMSRIDAGGGMLIAYSTGLDDVAQEGTYAPILAEEIRRQGQPAETVFSNVQKRVAQQTGFRQKPWYSPNLLKLVCFAGCAQPQAALPSNEAIALGQALASGDLAQLQAFQSQFPSSPSRGLVAQQIAVLSGRDVDASGMKLSMTAPLQATPSYKPGDTFQDTLRGGGTGPSMVVLPRGDFVMGSPSSEDGRFGDEGPQQRVVIDYEFAVGKYEVTWSDYSACVSDKACQPAENDGFGQGQRPVTGVSWEDANNYAAWLSNKTGATYRLLSEAEWEYAARAGTTTPFSFGETISTDQANYNGKEVYGTGRTGQSLEQTVPAGSYPANAFGLHDLHGNVWEWVEDSYDEDYSNHPTDGSAFTINSWAFPTFRVCRGGAWSDGPKNLRSASRYWETPDFRGNYMGFRLARSLP